MVKKWVVVGGGGNGIMVRSSKEISSSPESQKLATGAVVEEQEISGTRLRFNKLSGAGPQTGWVSVSAGGKDLLVVANTADSLPSSNPLSQVASGTLSAQDALAIYKHLDQKREQSQSTGGLAAVENNLYLQLESMLPELFLEEQNTAAAIEAAEKAVEFLEKDKVSLAAAYTSLANAQLAQDLKDQAAANASKARTLFKELGDTEGEAFVSQLSIRIAMRENRTADAMQVASGLVSLARQRKDQRSLGAALLVKSEVFFECGRSEEASLAASEAQTLFGKCGEKREQANAALAAAYADMDREFGEATASSQVAADIYAELHDSVAQAGALYALANAHLVQIGVKQRTCVIPSRADTEACIKAAKLAIELYAKNDDLAGQDAANRVLQTVLKVNGAEPDVIAKSSMDTQSLMANLAQPKWGANRKVVTDDIAFNRQPFPWRDATANHHFTLVWEHQVQGAGQNLRAGYKTAMLSKASRSAALPMYHSIKNHFNSSTSDEGPLVIHMNATNSSWEFGTSFISVVSTITAMVTCKVNKLVYIQVNECPPGSEGETSKVRQMYMSPITLSVLRSARLEAPQMTLGYLALDTATWFNNRAEVIASLPDVMQSEESEIHYYKGTPIAPTLIQRNLEAAVRNENTKTVRVH